MQLAQLPISQPCSIAFVGLNAEKAEGKQPPKQLHKRCRTHILLRPCDKLCAARGISYDGKQKRHHDWNQKRHYDGKQARHHDGKQKRGRHSLSEASQHTYWRRLSIFFFTRYMWKAGLTQLLGSRSTCSMTPPKCQSQGGCTTAASPLATQIGSW